MSKDYKELAFLASRLAESVLMDLDKEEQVRLAKEVACECHKCHEIFNKESIEFAELVKRMREAQVKMYEPYVDEGWWADRAIQLSKEVDEYLKKMEE